MNFVLIKLAGAPGPFLVVDIVEGDIVGVLARRACAAFPSWRAEAVSLFLVPAARARTLELDHSSASDILSGDPLFSGSSLASAGVEHSSCLLAQRSVYGAGLPVGSVPGRALAFDSANGVEGAAVKED